MKKSSIPQIVDKGIIVEGRISSITDFGIFVDINLTRNLFIYKPDAKKIKKELIIGNYVQAKISKIEYGKIQYIPENMFNADECEKIRNRFYRKEHPLYRIYCYIICLIEQIGLKTIGNVSKVTRQYALVNDEDGYNGMLSLYKNMKKIKEGDRIQVYFCYLIFLA